MTLSLSTPLCDLLGIEVPIVQAPIGSATCPELAAAVSRAGGLGTLALTWTEPDGCAEKIRRTRALTDRPFAVNLVLDWDPRERVEVCARQRVPLISTFWGDPDPYVDLLHDALRRPWPAGGPARDRLRDLPRAVARARMSHRPALRRPLGEGPSDRRPLP